MWGRVIFLIVIAVALIGINVGLWTIMHKDSDSTVFPVAIDINTPTPPQTYTIPLVAVTRFQTLNVLDMEDVTTAIQIPEPFVDAVEQLSYWEGKAHTLERATWDDMSEFLANPTDEIWLVPVTLLRPTVRALDLDGRSVFDMLHDVDAWPLAITLDDGSEFALMPDGVSELAIGGTVVLSRGVAERINKNQDPLYPWQEVADVLKQADVAIVNFKGAITSDCVYDGYTLQFCGASHYLDGMVEAGIDAVSLSGNHIGDYGQTGMRETVEFLQAVDVRTTGLGRGYEEAFAPAVFEMADGTTVALVAYNNVFGTAPCADNTQRWGVTCLLDDEEVAAEIAALNTKYDVIIAYPNWGPEYVHLPDTDKQVAWGRVLVEAGADLVVGDQAHWVQTMKFHDDTPIFYGMGNFVFDQMWSEKTREGLLLRVYLYDGRLLSIRPVPVKIYDYAQPRIEEGASGRAILDYLSLPLR